MAQVFIQRNVTFTTSDGTEWGESHAAMEHERHIQARAAILAWAAQNNLNGTSTAAQILDAMTNDFKNLSDLYGEAVSHVKVEE